MSDHACVMHIVCKDLRAHEEIAETCARFHRAVPNSVYIDYEQSLLSYESGKVPPAKSEVSEEMVEAAYQHLKATVGKNTSDMRMNSVGLVLFTISDVRAALVATLSVSVGGET